MIDKKPVVNNGKEEVKTTKKHIRNISQGSVGLNENLNNSKEEAKKEENKAE